jgi:hypothetical protein
MYTEKVKNVLIIMLILLNAVIFGLIMADNGKHTLSRAQVSAVERLLRERGIKLAAEIPREHRAMRAMTVIPYVYDFEKLAELFFPGEDIKIEHPWRKVVAYVFGEEGGRELEWDLESDGISYYNEYGYTTQKFAQRGYLDIEAGRELCDAYIQSIIPHELEFVFNYYEVQDDYVLFDYRGYYEGFVVHSNFIRLLVDDRGIISAKCKFIAIPDGFTDYTREIRSADEAVFALVKDGRIRNHQQNDADITIVKIEMVYHIADRPAGGESSAKASPCYNIDFEINGLIVMFLVDAYTAEALPW